MISTSFFTLGVNSKELQKISGSGSNTFTAKSFKDLLKGSFVKRLQQKSCDDGKSTLSCLLPNSFTVPVHAGFYLQFVGVCLEM